MTTRRAFLAGSAAIIGSRLSVPAAHAQDVTVKVGALRTIPAIGQFLYDRFQPAGMKIEIVPLASPADCKNAVVSKSVDFGGFGMAAAILGASVNEPVTVIGGCCNRGMALVARKDLPIEQLADLKGRKVGIWPGSTQEVFIMERLRMEGMSIQDIEPTRISFGEMATALARGDIDAYVGAEPGPAISVSTGVGKVVEYPYSTPMGSLNVILATHPDTISQRPDLVRKMLQVHKQASEFGMANREGTIQAAIKLLGMKREAVEASLPNIELTWQLTPELMKRARIYADHMFSMKQIRAVPDFGTLFNTKFSDELAKAT